MAGLRRAHPAVSSHLAEPTHVRAVPHSARSHVGRHQSLQRCRRVIAACQIKLHYVCHCEACVSDGSNVVKSSSDLCLHNKDLSEKFTKNSED